MSLKVPLKHAVWAAALALGSVGTAHGEVDSLLNWQDLSALKVYHAYSASDGRTYVEEISLPSSTKPSGGKPAQVYFLGKPDSVAIARSAHGSMMDWHYAGASRHLIVPMQGDILFDLGDGKPLYVRAGEAILAEDWTGKGHKSGCVAQNAKTCVVIDMLIDANPRAIPLRDPPK